MEKKKLLLRFSSVVISLVLIAAMALCMTSCGKTDTVEDTSSPAQVTTAGPKELGTGATSFAFSVTYADGAVDEFVINTDKTTLGDALLEVGLISGSESEYGLMVDTVNGVKADYNTDGAYWALYIGSDYATTGVDQTEITAGAAYSFVYTKA